MKVLIDCDVVLDVLLARSPYVNASSAILDWAEKHPGHAAVAWHTISNIAYIAKIDVRQFIRELMAFVEIASTGSSEMESALAQPLTDFEDAMQVAAAESFGAQLIVTRNVKDYAKATIKVMTPEKLVLQLNAGSSS